MIFLKHIQYKLDIRDDLQSIHTRVRETGAKVPGVRPASRWRKFQAAAGSLLWGIALLLSLSACTSQPARSSPVAAPEETIPAADSDQRASSAGQASSPAEQAAPAAAQAVTGFNIQGWT